MLLLIVVIFSYILVFHVFLCTKESFVTIGDFPERVKQQPILEKYVDLYAGKREQIVGKGSFACGSSFVDLLCPGGSNLSGIVLHASKVDSTSVGGVDLVCGDGSNNTCGSYIPTFETSSSSHISSLMKTLPFSCDSNVPITFNATSLSDSDSVQRKGVTVFYDVDSVTGIAGIKS